MLVNTLALLCVAILFSCQITIFFILRRMEDERDTWQKERQMLLDRIQAPSFAEYTNKVVREKKAEQPKEEEKPVDFVS